MKDTILKNYLPLKIVHGWKRADRTFEENCAYVTCKLQELSAMGFGGVVTNVDFGKVSQPENGNEYWSTDKLRQPKPMQSVTGDYLNNEEDWALLRYTLDEIERLGLRAWLYDEKGYPSGGAGGLTLLNHPEYECRAVAKIAESLEPGESKTIDLPRGHLCFLYGATYPCGKNGEPADLSPIEEYLCNGEKSLTFTNQTSEKQLICVFADKYLYEGTHSVHNVHEARRYPDLMNRDAVREFIRNTYEPYTANIGKHYDNGTDLIESYFTDEPSLMGCYINAGLYPGSVHDQYDDSIPLYPIVSFGRDVENTFESLSGMSFRKNLVCLFYSDKPQAKKARYFYYLTTSKLFEDSYFHQLSDYCAANGTKFGGHLLLEDDIRHHVIFEGNFFSFLRHMHIPSIDMLHSLPENVRRDMFTPKLVSSVAHAYNRPHVMSEVSAHAQGGKVTIDQMYASLALQYAYGVDIFTSYYSEKLADQETYAKYNRAIERFGSLMAGGMHNADVLLCYPIETFMMNHRDPEGRQYSAFTKEENACRDGLYSVMYELCDAQVDFDFADFEVLKNLSVKNGKLLGNCGAEYKYLVLPPMELTAEMSGVLLALEQKGVKLCIMRDPCFADLNSAPFGKKFSTASALVTSFDRYEEGFAIDLDAPHRGVACLSKNIDGQNRYLFVNSTAEPKEINCALCDILSPTLYNPLTDSTVPMQTAPDKAGTRCRFTLGGYETLIIQ